MSERSGYRILDKKKLEQNGYRIQYLKKCWSTADSRILSFLKIPDSIPFTNPNFKVCYNIFMRIGYQKEKLVNFG